LEFKGASNNLSGNTAVGLNIAVGSGSLPGNRTNFVRTDATPSAVVYDATHKLIYAANSNLSRVSVIDPTSNQIMRQIPVPDARGISLSPDSSRILVSGLSQQVVWIDTSTQQIVERDTLPLAQPTCSACPPEMVYPGTPMVLASGKVIFLGWTVFYGGILEWDPVAGQITLLKPPSTFNFGQGTIGVRSADGSKALFSTNTKPGSIALFDSATDSFVATLDFGNFPFSLAANPNGTQFAVAVNLSATLLLDNLLNQKGQAPVGGVLNGMTYSPDGGTLYVVSSPVNVPLISSIDASTFQVLGQAPAYSSSVGERVPPLFTEIPQAADSTGMLFGIGDHGVALDDSTFFQNINSTAIPPAYALTCTPAEGLQSSSTQVTIATQSFNTAPDIWFGTVNGTKFSLNSFGQAKATATPSATAGPVNVKIISPDGTEANMPEAFTYGVVAADSPILAVPPSGGVIADVFGYGFGSDTASPVQVEVGNNAASIQENKLFNFEYPLGYPFPLDYVRFTLPSGVAGPADITINSATGTAKIPGGVRYLETVNDYSSSDIFGFILYDSKRQQLYLSAGTHIDVFSISAHAFVSPITPPTLSGTSKIYGLALTPDGSKLLAADYPDNSVAIIDPDSPATAQAVQIVPPGASPYVEGPTELAATSTGHVFITIASTQVEGGGGAIYDLDLSTDSVTVAQVGSLQIGGNYLSASRDGSKVFVVAPGFGLYIWNASNGTWSTGQSGSSAGDGSTSGDGNVFAANYGSFGNSPGDTVIAFLDSAVNNRGLTRLPEYLAAFTPVGGMKLNDSGSLLYLPAVAPTISENLVDIYDVQRNELKERISFSQQFPSAAQTVNIMALDTTGQNIFLITQTGLTMATLDAVPLSVGSITPSTAHAGGSITVRGSGFSHSTTATFNGVAASLTFVDGDTLQATVPSSLAAGAVSISLSDPDGFTYSLDSALTIN
jgi:DNA-binding beta-propeller fold protein YncE